MQKTACQQRLSSVTKFLNNIKYFGTKLLIQSKGLNISDFQNARHTSCGGIREPGPYQQTD